MKYIYNYEINKYFKRIKSKEIWKDWKNYRGLLKLELIYVK
jgi:hypothetical protein